MKKIWNNIWTFVQANYWILFVIPAVLRVWYGELLGVNYFWDQGYDDRLMMDYTDLPNYFVFLRSTNVNLTMLKELGEVVFLWIVNLSGLPYSMFMSLFWVGDGLLVYRLVNKITGKKKLAYVLFLVIIFTPSAFDMWCGIRLYRSAMMTPLYLLTFLLLMLLLVRLIQSGNEKKMISKGRVIFDAVVIGLVFSLTYYMKEDGAWVKAVCALFLVLFGVNALWNYVLQKNKTLIYRTLVAIFVPVILFEGITVVYKSVNYHFFGVYETNMRTSGEPGRFLANLYSIESDNRTIYYTVPVDVIDKAFEASETLSNHPEFYEAIMTTNWSDGDYKENPIHGDFFGWIIKDEIFRSGVASDWKEAEAFYKQVNDELEAAFKDGTLKKDPGFKITSSLPAIDGDELKWVLSHAFWVYRYHVFMDGFQTETTARLQEEDGTSSVASVICNMNLTGTSIERGYKYRKLEVDIAIKIAEGIVAVFKVVMPILFFGAILGVLKYLIFLIRGKKKTGKFHTNQLYFFVWLVAIGSLLVSYVYSVAVFWFAYFISNNMVAMRMYTVGAVGILAIFEILGWILLTQKDYQPKLQSQA